ncbi:MAG: YlzJ-like family protein [Firmicutes bacterium]|nr:YlzJ-like family protein [Bacillota bacterium]MDD4264485.1 YlzJ-like family protein [Bacillota bacterium]MDD4694098.1 YlzJ-like family protein [Bacillota bacterium]
MFYTVMPLEAILDEEDRVLEWKSVGTASLLVEPLDDGTYRLERIEGAPLSWYTDYQPGDILKL